MTAALRRGVGAFWRRAYEENVTGMAAMVAYNLMLSVFPFALLLLFITGQLLQSSDVQTTILRDLQELFPSTEQDTLRSTLDDLRARSTEIGIVAIVAGLWIGASFWGAMDTAFCRIYHVECRGWWAQKRFSLIMLAVVALFLAASVAVPAAEMSQLFRNTLYMREVAHSLSASLLEERFSPFLVATDHLPLLFAQYCLVAGRFSTAFWLVAFANLQTVLRETLLAGIEHDEAARAINGLLNMLFLIPLAAILLKAFGA